jgi:hypothetical protein
MQLTSIYDDKNHTLLVELPIAHMFHYGLEAKAMGFKAKEEFHITVIGRKAGKIISDSLKSNDHRKVLNELLNKAVLEYQSAVLNRNPNRNLISSDYEMRIIEKLYPNIAARKSLVIMLEADELTLKFHHKLDALFPGIIDHLPVPHITIGVDYDHSGIGLTPFVLVNELHSNFLVASPTQLNRYKSQVESLQRENESLEHALHNESCDCCDNDDEHLR